MKDRQALERMKRSDELLPWLEDAFKSGIDTLKGFINGIQQDLTAVMDALSLPWSKGQTEDQVNRLKIMKRQMYGLANFDLLRKRVITYPVRC